MKIKEIFNNNSSKVEDELNLLSKKIHLAINSIKDKEEEITQFLEETKILKKEQEKLSKTTTKLSEKLDSAVEKMTKTTAELSMFKPRIEKKLTEKFDKIISEEISKTTNTIQKESSAFIEAKNLFEKQIKENEEILKEMKRFQIIAKELKNKDFSLEKYSKELEKKDGEKLRLLKKIDNLENILARMKRNK